MTSEEVLKTEKLVNERILEDAGISVENMRIDKAREKGATALFGEKYGDEVRVVTTGEFSMELCGGTHLSHTSSAGLFVITSESGVAAGVRRIEALTGNRAYEYVSEKRSLLNEVAEEVRALDSDVPARVDKIQKELKAARKQIEELKKKAAAGNVSGIFENPDEINGTKVIIAEVDGADMNALRGMCDAAREKHDDCVVVLAGVGEKISLAAAATGKAVGKGIHSGNIIREVAKITGGGGGGRPDMAQAGGKDPSKIGEALEKADELIKEVLS
jgi:alanyl-tRNA synthetase